VRPSGWVFYFGVDRPGPRWTGSFMENPTLIGVSLSDGRVIIVIMHVLVVELLCQVVMGWIPVLECLSQARVGAYTYGLSWLALNGLSTREPGSQALRSVLRIPLSMATGGPGAGSVRLQG
jgi:hypothetical protein